MDMLSWLRANGPHAKTYIAKHCGLSNYAQLLSLLEKSGQVEWHETLYEDSRKVQKTMRACFIDGTKPFHGSPSEKRSKVLSWVSENPGHLASRIEKVCGVVQSEASEIITELLKAGELEMIQSVKSPDTYGCFISGSADAKEAQISIQKERKTSL